MEILDTYLPESFKRAADLELAGKHRGPGHEQNRSKRRLPYMPDEVRSFYQRKLQRLKKDLGVD